MCRGRPRHHIEEENRRQAAYIADLQQKSQDALQLQMDRLTTFQEEANTKQTEALRQITESAKQPYKIRTAAEAGTPIMRTRQKSAEARRNLASLRISRTPSTNVGMETGGTNIG